MIRDLLWRMKRQPALLTHQPTNPRVMVAVAGFPVETMLLSDLCDAFKIDPDMAVTQMVYHGNVKFQAEITAHMVVDA